MPSSKRATGNFTVWTGASESWAYNNPVTNAAATINRGNMNTVVKSANLVVYGNVIGMGAIYADQIYADITGNLVLPFGTNYGIVYRSTDGSAAISSKFTVNDSNSTATMSGNITATGTTGNITANNFIGNRAFLTSANVTSANISNANISGNLSVAYIRAAGYLNQSGINIVYGDSNVFDYLSGNVDAKQILLGTTQGGYIVGNGYVSITGNITGNNFIGNSAFISGNANVTGNVIANYFLGNGAFITGLPAGYSNANVANYLPIYSGNLSSLTGDVTTTANVSAAYLLGNGAYITGLSSYSGNISANNITVSDNSLTNSLNVTGLATFSTASNLRISGGNLGQVLTSNGAGGVSFANVNAAPGNMTGSFQYNRAGTLAGLDYFIYNYLDLVPSVQLTNLVFMIDRSTSSASNQLEVVGNARLSLASIGNVEDTNSGYLELGGIDKLLLVDVVDGLPVDGQFAMVNGNRLSYANAVKSIVTGNASQITIGGNVMQPNISIANSGVTAGTYGNATTAMTVAIGRDGRVTSAANATIALPLPISNSTVSSTLSVPAQTLTIAGTANRVSSGLSGQTYTLSAPQDLHTSANFQVGTLGVGTAATGTAGTVTAVANVNAGNFYTTGTLTSGPQYITGNVNVTGNINVTGNLNYSNVTDLVIGDPLIYIGANNSGNVYDLGMVVSYNDGTYQHGGWVRDASDGTWKLFGNVVAEPTTTIDFANAIYQPMRAGAITATSGSYSLGLTVTGNITGGNISTAGNLSGGYVLGNGAFMTGLPAGYSNADVANYLATGAAVTINTTGNITTTANVSAAYVLGNGAFLTGLPSSYSNANVAAYLASNANVTILTTGNITGGNLVTPGIVQAAGNVQANNFIGTGTNVVISAGSYNWTFDSFGNLTSTGNTVGNNITMTGVANLTTAVLGNASTVTTANYFIGYRDIPQIALAANVSLAATSAGKHYYSTSAAAIQLTIPNNSTVSWPIGTAITVISRGTGNINIGQDTGVSLYLAGNSTAGNRTITTYGMATLLNVEANVWMINGSSVV